MAAPYEGLKGRYLDRLVRAEGPDRKYGWRNNLIVDRCRELLAGFMIGALRKVWPFQRDLTPGEIKLKHKHFEPFWPAEWDATVTWCLVAGVVAMILVLSIDRLARTDRTQI